VIYLLDTNTISYWMEEHPTIIQKVQEHIAQNDVLAVCGPIYFELQRGLLWRNSTAKLTNLNEKILPQLSRVPFTEGDWLQAARFWADATRQGKSIEDVDLLVAAVAYRINAIIVSSDQDFDPLPIQREDWR
jgi:predicted nucleic acid-binding protein